MQQSENGRYDWPENKRGSVNVIRSTEDYGVKYQVSTSPFGFFLAVVLIMFRMSVRKVYSYVPIQFENNLYTTKTQTVGVHFS